MASLEGAFFKDMSELTELITMFRVRIEGCLDFPEEHEDFFDSGKSQADIDEIIRRAELAQRRADQGLKLNEGARIVLSGAPNAGKSSLLNALSGSERAIVTSIPGTTRDILSADIEIDGVPVTITDTAGIRDTPSDEIEAIGIRKALDALKQADLVLFMIDGSSPPDHGDDTLGRLSELKKQSSNVMVVVTKSDLSANEVTTELLQTEEFSQYKTLHISVKTENGLVSLRRALADALGIMPVEGVYSARARHLAELKDAIAAVYRAKDVLLMGDLVLCAQEMRDAQDHLGTVTGVVTSDDILGKIFSTFCIGK